MSVYRLLEILKDQNKLLLLQTLYRAECKRNPKNLLLFYKAALHSTADEQKQVLNVEVSLEPEPEDSVPLGSSVFELIPCETLEDLLISDQISDPFTLSTETLQLCQHITE